MWFERGILHSVTKANGAITKESLSVLFNYIRMNSNGEKICWISDISKASPPTKEGRDFGAEESPQYVKALALITNSVISKAIAEIYLLVKKPPYPTRLFIDETEAKLWLYQFCEVRQNLTG